MNVKTGIVLALLAFMTFAATDALAAGPVYVNAALIVQSKWIFRGLLVTDGPVLEPYVAVGSKGFNLWLWGNIDLSDVSDSDTKEAGEMNIFCLSPSYNRSFALLNVSVGAIHFAYPTMTYKTATTEIYVNASGSVPGHPSFTLNKDVDEVKGLYGELTAIQTIPVGLLFGIEISGGLGFATKKYNKYYFGKDVFALTNCRVGLGAPIGIGALVKIKPSVTYTGIINRYISDNLDANDINAQNVCFSIIASVSF